MNDAEPIVKLNDGNKKTRRDSRRTPGLDEGAKA
jgi:hypothetical protein